MPGRRDPLADAERLIPRIYAYVAYRLGDGPEAEDVTSEVFERALRYRESYSGSKGEPVAWLLGIARRCVDSALAARPEIATAEVEVTVNGDLEDEALRRITLAEALARLGERDRELIALRFGSDLTARQIADVVGSKTNAVEVALHRALARLRAILEGEEALAGAGEVSVPGRDHDDLARREVLHDDLPLPDDR
jgi:RNA polymerase sigma-70 factor, ECF subfamily